LPTPASAVSPRWASAIAAGNPAVTVLSVYARGNSVHEKTMRRPLLSFVPPSSGMFVWLELYFGDVPDKTGEDGSVITPEYQFWECLADAGVLTVPGRFFLPEMYTDDGGNGGASTPAPPSASMGGRIGHLRLSYSSADVSANLFTSRAKLTDQRGSNRVCGVGGDDAPWHEDFCPDAAGILSCLRFISRRRMSGSLAVNLIPTGDTCLGGLWSDGEFVLLQLII
jgi:hypothetical protein